MKINWNVFTPLMLGMSTLGMTTLSLQPVLAQQQFELGTSQLQQGTLLPVSTTSIDGPEYYAPDSVHPFTAVVNQNVFDSLTGQLVVPAGTPIYGQLQPVAGGLQFVANSIEVNGRTFPLQATSGIINDEKDPREFSAESVAGDAAIGAAAGAVLGILTGGASTVGVLTGAAAGVGVGNVTAPQVVVLRPNQTLNITLTAPAVF